MKHRWVPSQTPLRELRRWKCKGCGLKRRRVAPVASARFPIFLRSFWMYQEPRAAVWFTRAAPACTGHRS